MTAIEVATVDGMMLYRPTHGAMPSYPTEQEWEEQRELISNLYSIAPLWKVMEFMKDAHNFRATEKMYKSRLAKWGLGKKSKEREMRAIVRKKKQRDDLGKDSMFRVRGQMVEYEALVHYWKRKNASIEDVMAQRMSSATPETVECVTPVPSPVTPPKVLVIPERIFRVIGDYYHGSFQAGTWVKPTEPNRYCYSIKSQVAPREQKIRVLHERLSYACHLFKVGEPQEAGNILDSSFSIVKDILLTEDPQTLLFVFEVIHDIRVKGRDEIAHKLLKYFSDLGELVLGTRHPLHLVCNWLAQVEWSFDDIVTKASGAIADHFESEIGSMSPSALDARLRYTSVATFTQSRTHVELYLRDLLHDCEANIGLYDMRTLAVCLELAHHLSNSCNYHEAIHICNCISAYAEHLDVYLASVYYKAEASYLSAFCWEALQERKAAKENMTNAIVQHLLVPGIYTDRAKTFMLNFESWLIEWGEVEAAAEIRDRRRNLALS